MQDEGIVQPVSKEMDQLSRRLHHHTPSGRPGGVFFCLFFTILKLMGCYRSVLSLDPRDAAYIAGLIDGEGTITLSREHRNENRRLVVSIASTERCLLEFVAVRTGVRQDYKQTHNERTTHVELCVPRDESPSARALAASPTLPSILQSHAGCASAQTLFSANTEEWAIHREAETCQTGVRDLLSCDYKERYTSR